MSDEVGRRGDYKEHILLLLEVRGLLMEEPAKEIDWPARGEGLGMARKRSPSL